MRPSRGRPQRESVQAAQADQAKQDGSGDHPPPDSWDTIRGADTYPDLGLEGTPKVVLVGGGPARLKQLARAINSD